MQYKSTIAVESRHRAYLIGHKGKRISKLQEECNNVMIVIPKSDRPEDVVEVSLITNVECPNTFIGTMHQFCNSQVHSWHRAQGAHASPPPPKHADLHV